jgi:DNA-binding NarL/FixJ family response regulator
MAHDPIRVLVVDGHRTFAELLGLAVGRQPDLQYVGHAATGAEALRLVDELRPDVVLMDADLPDADGIDTTERLRAGHPETRVVVLTASSEPALVGRATTAGVSGVLAKNGALGDVLNAVHTAHGGGMTVSSHLLAGLLRSTADTEERTGDGRSAGGLTAREHQVLRLMGVGLDVRSIAHRLGISVHTCRDHTRSVLAKLHAHSRLEAVAVATRRGLIGRQRDT